MSQSKDGELETLDETTWYSVLGLTSQASDVEIRKSYMRLAKRLHPDKSKTEGTAELFKIVVNAHSTLTDSEKRRQYDNELRRKHLYEYNIPKAASHKSKSGGNKPNVRKSKPYGEQPYGFGSASNKSKDGKTSNKSSVPIFQSFNLKTYQRKHNHKQEMETEQQNYRQSAFRAPEENTETNNTGNQEEETSTTTPHTFPDVEMESARTKTAPQPTHRRQPSHLEEEDATENTKRSKVAAETTKTAGSKVHLYHDFRRAARHKAGLRDQVHRSVSPVKTPEIKRMDPTLKDSFTSGINVVINQMYENIQKTSREASPTDTDSEMVDAASPPKRAPEEMGTSESIPLDDVYQEGSFDMKDIDDTLDSIRLTKKTRLPTSDQAQTENLHEPVNYTLPRVYKRESLSSADNFGMDGPLEEMDVTIPQPPILPLGIGQSLGAYELELLRNETAVFCERCNSVKAQLLRKYSSRVRYDQEHSSQLFKVENFAALNEGNRINTSIMNKIREVEEIQQVAIQQLLAANRPLHNGKN